MTESNGTTGSARRGLPEDTNPSDSVKPQSEATTPVANSNPQRAKRGETTESSTTEVTAQGVASTTEATPKKPAKKVRRNITIAVIIAALLAGFAILYYQFYVFRTAGSMTNAPVWEPGATVTVPQVPEPDLAGLNCPTENVPFVPTSFTIHSKDMVLRVVSLGLDQNGAAAAPPDSGNDLLAWFNQGPKPGSAEGQALFTGHTFKNSMSIGNRLNAGLLTPGDVVVVADDSGNKACYQYTHDLKIWLKDYDPDSNLIYDNFGDPRLAIIVCADWRWLAPEADSRVVYYFNLLNPTKAS